MAPVARRVYCPLAMLPDGWAHHVVLRVSESGDITAIDRHPTEPVLSADTLRLDGPCLPGMPNLHSHAFQRAIAGCTQRRGPGEDSFWTWREAMYASLRHIGPEETEAIAAGLYVELLEGGFTSVAEFHYVHHDITGTPYTDPCELSWRILAASVDAGIGLTHLPVLYRTGGFDGRSLGPAQARFGWTPDGILALIDRFDRAVAADPDRCVGLALHSLRAVSPADLTESVSAFRRRLPGAPIHIHISEQQAEVDQCLELRGQRPVAWLLDHAPVDRTWCFIHATHIDPSESAGMRAADVIAGLCPTTEADLGDGLFPAVDWTAAGGAFGVGTDSHVGRDAADELRWLEYGQRLNLQRRNVLRFDALPMQHKQHTGAASWREAARGGARALGRTAGAIQVGARADFVSLQADAPTLIGLSEDDLVDALVFGGARGLIDTVAVGGRIVVREGRHLHRDRILGRMTDVFRRIRSGPTHG